MHDFFSWLNSNMLATNFFIGLVGVVVLSVVLIYIIAFFQGREISLYPLKIGPRPVKPPKNGDGGKPVGGETVGAPIKESTVPALNKGDFWQVLLGTHPNEKVYVIPSAKQGVEWRNGIPTSKPGHTAQLSYNEVVAFLRLRDSLQSIKERLILVHGGIRDSQNTNDITSDFPQEAEGGTLIIIGSSHANKFCDDILADLKIPKLPFRFEEKEKKIQEDQQKKETYKCINLYQDETGQWIKKPISFPGSEVDEIKEDFGIILRVTNPWDGGGTHKVLIMGGSHGLGTESAVNYVASKESLKFLNDKVQDKDFEALFQAYVSRQRGHGLRLSIRKLAVLENGVWVPVRIA